MAFSLSGQTVVPASFDTFLDFWTSTPYNSSRQNDGTGVYASNSAIAPQASDPLFFTEYDEMGMLIKFDLSGVTPAEVNAPGFQALLDVMFQGFMADFNRYADYNPDPGPNPGAGDGFVYLDVLRVGDSYTDTANRWMKKSNWAPADKTFLNWDDSSYILEAAEILAPGGTDVLTAFGTNFNDSNDELPLALEDQTVLIAAQSIGADLTASARIQYAPTGAPVHLGGSGIFWSAVPGDNMDDVGNTIVGDGPSNQNFGIVLAFDLPETARDKVLNGGVVTLNGETILATTIGDIDWSNIIVTVQAVGNSVDGTLGSSGPGAMTQSSANLPASDFDGVYDGAGPGDDAQAAYVIASSNLGAHFAANPTTTDKVKFSVNITDTLASLPLSATIDRLMIGIWARVDGIGTEGTGLNGYVASNNDGIADRIAFKSSAFKLKVLPPYELETPPNTYGELVWDVTALVKDWVNGDYPNNGLFLTVNKTKSWGEQVNFHTMESVGAQWSIDNPGDAAPLLRMGIAPDAPVAQGVMSDPNFDVQCSSQVGYYYQLQYSNDMVNWVNATVEGLKVGTGGTLTFSRSAPASGGGKVFYRVNASLAP
jgi:hypothetical protein